MQAHQIRCREDNSVRDALVDPDSLELTDIGDMASLDGVEVVPGTISVAMGRGSAQRVDCLIGKGADGVRIHLAAATIRLLEAEEVYLQLLAAFAAMPEVPVYATDTSQARTDVQVDWSAVSGATPLEPVGSGWSLTAPAWVVDQASRARLGEPVDAQLTVAWDGSANWLLWAKPDVLAKLTPAPGGAGQDDGAEVFRQAVSALRDRPEDGVCRVDEPDVVRRDVRVDWDSAGEPKPGGEWRWTVEAKLVVQADDGAERTSDPVPVVVWWDGGQSAWRAGLTEEEMAELA